MPTSAPRPASPSKRVFDPFNSSATGHQRPENAFGSSTSWRSSRTLKLNGQFHEGAGGGKRVNDTVGAGSLDFGRDGRTKNGGWEKGAKGLRPAGQQSLWECMKTTKRGTDAERPCKRIKTSLCKSPSPPTSSPTDAHVSIPVTPIVDEGESRGSSTEANSCPQIFAHLTFYINGSTAPAVSDHRLKHILSQHGGRVSVGYGRRVVTHVIIGRPSSKGGSGGGLAGSKLQKEISRIRGKSVNFVTADWVLESVAAGKRLPESRFAALRLAPQAFGNVEKMFSGNLGPLSSHDS